MSGGYLRRYTALPSLIYALTERKITLLDPEYWDDKNDSHYLSVYRRNGGFRSVLALCFATDSETYHHWSVFAHGQSGVCVEFKRNELLSIVRAYAGIRARPVRYLKLTDIRRRKLTVEQLPFVKRYAFRHEAEFRIVYASKSEGLDSLDLPMPLTIIARITLSPWLPPALAGHVKRTLWAIPGCGKLSIVRSTLIGNKEWKRIGDEAT